MYRSREWLYERIRRDRRVDPVVSARAPARPVPRSRKKPPRKSVLEPVAGYVDAMLREGPEAPRDERHTVDRIARSTGTDSYRLNATENEYRSARRS